MGQEGKSNFHNMTMTMFYNAIVFACIRARTSMTYAKVAIEGSQRTKLPPPQKKSD